MYKLPIAGIKYQVLGIMRFLHTTPQKGFAPIALVVLLLFGIAAGTLLIQNGVNFLPKADDATFNCASWEAPNVIKYGTSRSCTTYNGCDGLQNAIVVSLNNNGQSGTCTWSTCQKKDPSCTAPPPKPAQQPTPEESCTAQGPNYVFIDGTCRKPCKLSDGSEISSGITKPLSCSADPLQKGKRFYQTCTDGVTENSYKVDPTCGTSQPGPASNDFCTLKGIKEPGSDTDVVIKKNQTWTGCDTQKNKVLYLCKGNNELSVDIKERNAPGCQTAPAAKDECDPNHNSSCGNGKVCAQTDVANNPHYVCIIDPAPDYNCTNSDFLPISPDTEPTPCSPGYTRLTCTNGEDRCYKNGVHPTLAAPAGDAYVPTTTPCTGDQLLKDRKDPKSGNLCPRQDKPAYTKCVIDKLETRFCVGKDQKDGDTCDDAQKTACKGRDCYIIGGVNRCKYPDSAKVGGACDKEDDICNTRPQFNEECAIFTTKVDGKDYKYSACRKKADGGAGAAADSRLKTLSCPKQTDKDICKDEAKKFPNLMTGECYLLNDKDVKCMYKDSTKPEQCNQKDSDWCRDLGSGCVLETVKGSGDLAYRFSKCTNNQASRNADGSPGKPASQVVAPADTRSGSGTASRVGVEVADCGVDNKGVPIPCYKIGVFSPEELSKIEAQAKLASINYDKFRTIISENEEKIGKEVACVARNKIKAAEAATNQCKERK